VAARALLFDVDGTLWDSFPWYAEVLAGLSGLDNEAVLEQLRAGSSIVTLVKRCGVTDGQFRSACRRCVGSLRLYPAVRDTLAELDRRRTRCGIVTNLPERIAVPVLEALDLARHFSVIVTAGTVRRGKPHPDPLEYALGRMEISDPTSAYYVGDSSTDALAAERARVPFIWASYGYGSCPLEGAVVMREFREVLQL
jgi:HAD superfamily hydrolase (TIGR01549 family)